jgi:hypothetical protein
LVIVAAILGGLIVVALGILAGLYIVFEKRRGNLLFRPLSLKSNVTGNLPFGLVTIGAVIIAAGFLTP